MLYYTQVRIFLSVCEHQIYIFATFRGQITVEWLVIIFAPIRAYAIVPANPLGFDWPPFIPSLWLAGSSGLRYGMFW